MILPLFAVDVCGHKVSFSVHNPSIGVIARKFDPLWGIFCYTEIVQLRFYANMRTVTGTMSLEVDDTGLDTFRKLLNYVVTRYPETAFHLLDDSGELRKDVPVYVDGRNPRLSKDGIDSHLEPDAVVSFFSPVASGKINVEVLREPNFRKRE